MKVCLSGRQDRNFLKKADEIKLEYRDRRIIPDYTRDYPGVPIIVELVNVADEEIDWKLLQEYDFLSNGKIYICVSTLDQAKKAGIHSLKFYSGYPIESDFELQGWINVGASYARLGMPLFFELERLQIQYGDKIKFRTTPNICYTNNLLYENGVCGQWIRPEDIPLYSQYIEVIEFEEPDRKREQKLYELYMEKGEWFGPMKFLFTNFGHKDSVNRMILPEVARARINCGQKCMKGSNCRICQRAVDLAIPEKIEAYMEGIGLDKEKE